MELEEVEKFGKIRSFLWPIYKSEHKKFIPVLLMFFLISFNYNLLKTIKDSFIITANQSGAEALPFIKTWGILPMALLMTFFFTRLSNRFSKEKVFYIMMSGFLAFFLFFALFLYPARDLLHPNGLADALQNSLPKGFSGLIAIFRNWTATVFYIMAELWGVIILTVLFWGFTNNITSVKEAKRFYPLFAFGANISGVIAGQSLVGLSSNLFNPKLPFGTSAWDQSVVYINATIIVTGLMIIFLFRWYNKKIITQDHAVNTTARKKPKIKMSLRENFAYLIKSKYLICIALLVLTYNISNNLAEVLWKNQLKTLYPNPKDYSIYMGHITTWIGLCATFIAIFISGNAIRRFGWTIGALIPPVIMLITGLAFFSFLFFKGSFLAPVVAFFHSTPLMMCVFFGSMQNCLSRSTKYTLFDATKEMAFVPLAEESQMKGKAAIDGVGSRLGKSGGAFIFQGMLLFFGSLAASTPYVAIIFLIVIGIWAISAISLGKQFQKLTSKFTTINVSEKKDPLVVKAQSQKVAG